MSEVPEVLEYADRKSLDVALADAVAARLRQAVAERGEGVLAVSGGRTPAGFFSELGNRELEWNRITVTLVDERWVSESDTDSNARLVRETLLGGRAREAAFLPLKNEAPSAAAGEGECNRHLAGLGTIDVTVLGMGEDGHTASLFPGAPQLDSGLARDSGRSCVAVLPPDAAHWRLSMTLPRILDSRCLLLHVTGPVKRAVLEHALAGDPGSEKLPVTAVLRQKETPVTVYWAP